MVKISSRDIALIALIVSTVVLIITILNLRASLENVRLNSMRNEILRETQAMQSSRFEKLFDILE